MEENRLLVRQAQRGDVHAFARLYQGIYQDLYRFALYTLKNPQDAEDVVSDAVMDAFAGLKGLRQEDAFRGWIFRILTNKCRQRKKTYLTKTEELPEHLAGPEKDVSQDMDVRNAFFRLSEEERLILSMNLFAGYSSREIGQILELSDNTVRSKQSRALKKMQAELER